MLNASLNKTFPSFLDVGIAFKGKYLIVVGDRAAARRAEAGRINPL